MIVFSCENVNAHVWKFGIKFTVGKQSVGAQVVLKAPADGKKRVSLSFVPHVKEEVVVNNDKAKILQSLLQSHRQNPHAAQE